MGSIQRRTYLQAFVAAVVDAHEQGLEHEAGLARMEEGVGPAAFDGDDVAVVAAAVVAVAVVVAAAAVVGVTS